MLEVKQRGHCSAIKKDICIHTILDFVYNLHFINLFMSIYMQCFRAIQQNIAKRAHGMSQTSRKRSQTYSLSPHKTIGMY